MLCTDQCKEKKTKIRCCTSFPVSFSQENLGDYYISKAEIFDHISRCCEGHAVRTYNKLLTEVDFIPYVGKVVG